MTDELSGQDNVTRMRDNLLAASDYCRVQASNVRPKCPKLARELHETASALKISAVRYEVWARTHAHAL